jgi:hypothetical protein
MRGLTLAWMWLALGLFLLRVLAQIYAGLYAPAWLPAMEQWYSGLLPYPVLLPAQVLLLMLMTVVSTDNTRGRGRFCVESTTARSWLLRSAALYALVMLARYGVTSWVNGWSWWFRGTLPILFHWVLASYLLALGANSSEMVAIGRNIVSGDAGKGMNS